MRSLIGHGLVDELRLMTDPIVLGGGKGIFTDGGSRICFDVSTASRRALARCSLPTRGQIDPPGLDTIAPRCHFLDRLKRAVEARVARKERGHE